MFLSESLSCNTSEIREKRLLGNEDLPAFPFACSDVLYLALCHELTDGMFRYALDGSSSLFDREHLGGLQSRYRSVVILLVFKQYQSVKDFLNDLLNNRPSYNGGWLVFNKTLRWKKEKEYRFSVGSVEQEKVEPNNGFLLKNIKPKRIVLGEKFKRKGSIYDTILDYCLKNNIELCVMYKNNVMKVLYDKKGYYTNSYIPRVNIVKWIKDDGRKGH